MHVKSKFSILSASPMLLLASAAAATMKLSFGTPQDLGAGRFSAWSLSTIYNPRSSSYNLIISTAPGSSVLQSGDGKSWGNTYPPCNKTFGLLTPYPSPEVPPANFPLQSLGNTEEKYQGQKSAFHTFGGSGPTYYTIDAHGRFSSVTTPSVNLTFTGLPRDMGCIQTTCCNCPFRVDSGNMLRMPDTTLLLVMNVFYQPTPGLKGDGSSVVMYSSQGGLDWRFKSNIAVAEYYPWSGEGPNEATISLLADEKTLICIFRVDAGDGGTGGKP